MRVDANATSRRCRMAAKAGLLAMAGDTELDLPPRVGGVVLLAIDGIEIRPALGVHPHVGA